MADLDKIKFHYVKGNFFRIIHADGAVASISPTGDIVVSLFSQRSPIPQLTVQTVTEKGELGEEILAERIGKDGLVREIEVGVTAHPDVIKALIKLLQDKLEQFDKLKEVKQKHEQGQTKD